MKDAKAFERFGRAVQSILQRETEDYGEHTIKAIIEAAEANGIDFAHHSGDEG